MKVSQEMLAKTDRRVQPQTQGQTQSFEKIIGKQTKQLVQQELDALVEDISKQGEKLAKFRSFQDLAKFKRMIKRFLEKAVHDGLTVNEERSFHGSRLGHLTTVKKIDEKLVTLADDLLNQEKSTVDLLGVIGEIRGLLINLYI